MNASDLVGLLGRRAHGAEVNSALRALGTLARPSLDPEEAPHQHHDWVKVRRKGVEIGFVDAAYLRGEPESEHFRPDGLIVDQLYFYGPGRPEITPYAGALPHGLSLADDRAAAQEKLAHLGRPRVSRRADCWDAGDRQWIVSYQAAGPQADGPGLDCVLVKLVESPWKEQGPPPPQVTIEQWLGLFGASPDDPRLREALSPLDVPARVKEHDDPREVSFVRETGLELYFEEDERLLLPAEQKASGLCLGAVKFVAEREADARGWKGPLPRGLRFADDPDTLFRKVPASPAEQHEGRLTGYALWHFEEASLHVLYSTVQNRLLRVTWMAPGYHCQMPAGVDDLPDTP